MSLHDTSPDCLRLGDVLILQRVRHGTNSVGWVWGDHSRSSFDILWSCLAIIVVCTYKVVHLNLSGLSLA